MGVFARLLRRFKATEEASTAEAQSDTPTAQSEPAAEEAAEAKESAEAAADDRTEAESAADETAEDTSGDGVEIPKQQSSEDAADSEADEGART